jgi:uncharacterized repeat protein (TIGR03803 family)
MTDSGGTFGDGTIFEINTDGTGYSVLYSFPGGVDGANPMGDLTVSGSILYGMTRAAGANNHGIVFSFPISAVPEPGSLSLLSLIAAVGTMRPRRRHTQR